MQITFINNDGGGLASELSTDAEDPKNQITPDMTVRELFEKQIGGNPKNYTIRLNGLPVPPRAFVEDGDTVQMTEREVSPDTKLESGDRVSVSPSKVSGG